MAAIARRSNMAPVSKTVTLATADDLDGTVDNTQAFDITGAQRVIVVQVANGTAGKGLAVASDDSTGTEIDGVLNAAGVEPTGAAVFKFGPYEGPVAIRCGRKTTTTTGTTWVTGAPTVLMFTVGQTVSAPVALA
jgi:hypothetical protein